MSYPHPTAPVEENPPPAYNEAYNIGNSNPPTYESLYGQFRQVDSPSGLFTFAKRTSDVVCGTLGAAIILAFLNFVPLTMIIVGAINKENCDANPNIPTWMIVTGVMTIATRSLDYFKQIMTKVNHTESAPFGVSCLQWLINAFLFVWFIIGCVWVFGAYGQRAHCETWTYAISFAFIVVTLVVLALSAFCACCCCCCVCFRSSSQNSDSYRPSSFA